MNFWDERYERPDFFYGTTPNDFLRAEAHRIVRGGQVLCLAEGEGRNAIFLAQQGLNVTAVDGSAVGLRKAAQQAAVVGVPLHTVHADLAEYPFPSDAWDAIISIWCHVPPPLRQKLHRQMASTLKPGGVLILESYHPKQLNYRTGGPPVAELMMTAAGLREELVGMDIQFLEERDRDIQEGSGHSGQSAVVQLVAYRSMFSEASVDILKGDRR